MSKSLAEEIADLRTKVGDALFQESLADLTEEKAKELRFDWPFWARPEQRIPDGDWSCWLVLAGRGYGKALALDTPIPTPSGWTMMGDLRVGDEIFDEHGKPTRVTFATEVQHNRRCFAVRFDDGSHIIADAEHRWLTADKAARKALSRNGHTKPAVRTTLEIRDSLLIGRERNHAIRVAGALDTPDAPLPISPYTFGVWLGDGDSAGAMITAGAADVEEIRRLLEADGTNNGEQKISVDGGAFRWWIGAKNKTRDSLGRMTANDSVHSKLKNIGVIKNKHIPAVYLRSSIQQRTALLHGLMDTDGSVVDGHVELGLSNKRLAFDAFELVRSLGFKPTIAESDSTLKGVVVGKRWRITWTPRSPVFRLLRKMERCVANRKQQAGRTAQRFVVAVDEVESVPVRCITVDSPSHLFLAGDAMVPTHNTKIGAESVRSIVNSGEVSHVGLVARTPADARDVMIEGPAGILACTPEHERPVWELSKRRLTWPNGCVGTVFSGENPEQLRGPQHQLVWIDELMAFQYPQETWDNMSMGLRLLWNGGGHARSIVTSTPRPTKLLRAIMSMAGCVVTKGSTYDNKGNLDKQFLQQMLERYEGTRLGRQELMAEVLDEFEGALWTPRILDACRVKDFPALEEVVVAIDPPASSNPDTASEAGIVVAGRGIDGHGYILEDLSGVMTTAAWAKVAVDAFSRWEADAIVAEINNGGDMVEHAIRTVANVPVRKVRATRGKIRRAEPINSLYEQNRVHHVGQFPKLEDQMISYTGAPSDRSPDRMDAAVWGLAGVMFDAKQARDLGFA